MRFCPDKYHPFNASNVRQYVVQDYYTLAHDMPSLSDAYRKYGFSFQRMLEHIATERGFDMKKVWRQVDDAIVQIIKNNEEYMIKAVRKCEVIKFKKKKLKLYKIL